MLHTYGPGDSNSPAGDATAVIPNDTTELFKDCMRPRALYVGTGGTVRVLMRGESTPIDFVNVPSGTILPIFIDRVYANTTTASNMVALY